MAFERSSSADTADFTGGIQKYDCLCKKFSKDLYKNKYTKMNCWRNVADKGPSKGFGRQATRSENVATDHFQSADKRQKFQVNRNNLRQQQTDAA